MAQQMLFSMPVTQGKSVSRNDESIHVWARKWLATHYPGEVRFDREQLREEMLQDLPLRYIRDADFFTVWWKRKFQDVARAAGLGFLGGKDGKVLVLQMELPFNEFADYCIQLLRYAREDINAVERRLREYVELHHLPLDVDATIQAWKTEAGL